MGVRELRKREIQRRPSVHVTEVTDWLVLHDAQVVHGAAEGDLDSLADAGCASFHHFDFVYGLVYAQGHHLRSRKPLPGGERVSMHYNTCTRATAQCFCGIGQAASPRETAVFNIFDFQEVIKCYKLLYIYCFFTLI